ncbi:MAG: prepilin-type N-terminal cleavage/methylation domain-containing protein [Alistipes sp.]|nr:prepilin-type N-terminal cleavage/methylation domain-containing protein [Alistipes sp.]
MNPGYKIYGPLRAFTIAECLVVMVIGGIVFLGVTEGFGLFTSRTNQLTVKFVKEQENLTDLYTLREIFSVCDSLRADTEKINIYLSGVSTSVSTDDGYLIIERGNRADTLFRAYTAALAWSYDRDSRELPTVKLTVTFNEEDLLNYRFRPSRSEPVQLIIDIGQAEEPFIYD